MSRADIKRRWCLTLLILGMALTFSGLFLEIRTDPRSPAPKNSPKVSKELWVAAAADLQFAMDEMIQEFQKDHPEISVKASYGSSGNFFSQLVNQAPFDLFFSADMGYPRKLSEQGLALPGTDFLYAVGRIVIWVPQSSPIDVERLKIEALRHNSVNHIAIANPKHAPYGKAAEAAMRCLGVYTSVQEKLVYGENVSQTLQFVQSGTAEIGIIALSLALAPNVWNQGRYWGIPTETYPRMEQGGIILQWARSPGAARNFRSYVLESKGRALLRRYGFYLPGE